MKTLELNNLPTPVLIVWGLPEAPLLNCLPEFHRYKDFLMIFSDNDVVHFKHDSDNTKIGTLPEGRWQLIGKLSELTEKDYKCLVKSKNYPCCSPGGDGMYPEFTHNEIVYIDYTGDVSDYKDTATESFHSAIESEGYYMVNPLGQKPKEFNDYSQAELPPYLYQDDLEAWQKAQDKTLPANTLIFKK